MFLVDRIILYFKKKWAAYQEQKKFDKMYARLDANKAGRFSQKEYRKEVDRQKKMQMKKNREATEERKTVEKRK
jgi:hypothetical protein